MRATEALPLRHLSALMPSGRALVLAPHPDDEALGCGGLIAALAAEGRAPRVAFMSDGAGSHPHSRRYRPEALRRLRRSEAREAMGILGSNDGHFLDWPDGGVPSADRDFETAVGQVCLLADGCEHLVATSGLDPHVDHVSTSAIAREAARRLGLRLLLYPVWSWRYLYPGIMPIEPRQVSGAPRGSRLDITPQLECKRCAVMAHRSQTSRLIDDDPDGFMLTPAMLAVMVRSFEIFLEDTP